ncbi:tetratricopeptide repeat-containing sensor histidine kinase [Flavobacterium microcysteis]|nr:tetratricopeptide repeat-containing sensor histidine kinase [Flavobacterium microcysteis]
MMSRIRSALIVVFLFLAFSLFSQEQNNNLLDSEIRKIALENKDKADFYKAQAFFLEKNWDSTLVYSMKYLAHAGHQELADYCHYFRAFSFKNKKLLQQARKEFLQISKNFRFYYKVRLYLGEIALEESNSELAIHYFKEIENLPETGNYDFKRGVVYHNLGVCYLHQKKYDQADAYFSKGAEVMQAEKDTISLIGSYMNIANLYYEQYKDNIAIPYFEKAYSLSKKIKNVELKQNAALNMAVVAENNKKFPLALTYRKEYESWRDSLNDQNKVWAIAELEKKFTVKQKEKEIGILEAENKLKIAERNGFFYSSLLLLVLFGTGIYFYRQKIKSNRIILSQKNKLDELNAAKDQLFSIVSHDLRSSVNALKTSNSKLAESLECKNFEALDKQLQSNSAIAHSSYNLLDNLLHWALLQTKQLYFHKESVHLFSVVQQMEFNYKPLMQEKNISFENSVPKALFAYADLSSLKIILRNLIDNAIKFSRENGKITIHGSSSEDFCTLTVEDSGQGMSKEIVSQLLDESALVSKKENPEKSGTGLGMQLCLSMAQKNEGKLLIESEENKGTKISIQLLKANKNE